VVARPLKGGNPFVVTDGDYAGAAALYEDWSKVRMIRARNGSAMSCTSSRDAISRAGVPPIARATRKFCCALPIAEPVESDAASRVKPIVAGHLQRHRPSPKHASGQSASLRDHQC